MKPWRHAAGLPRSGQPSFKRRANSSDPFREESWGSYSTHSNSHATTTTSDRPPQVHGDGHSAWRRSSTAAGRRRPLLEARLSSRASSKQGPTASELRATSSATAVSTAPPSRAGAGGSSRMGRASHMARIAINPRVTSQPLPRSGCVPDQTRVSWLFAPPKNPTNLDPNLPLRRGPRSLAAVFFPDFLRDILHGLRPWQIESYPLFGCRVDGNFLLVF